MNIVILFILPGLISSVRLCSGKRFLALITEEEGVSVEVRFGLGLV